MAMKKSSGSKVREGASASKLIDSRIRELADWRGETLARVRALIREAVPEVVEEWKWGIPVWSHDGIICTGETYKKAVKLTFAKGASLPDPSRLFNSSLEGNTRRALDIAEGAVLDARAFKPEMVRVTPELPASQILVIGAQLMITGNAKGRTQYRVELAGSLTDAFGQKLGRKRTLLFQVGPAEPSLVTQLRNWLSLRTKRPFDALVSYQTSCHCPSTSIPMAPTSAVSRHDTVAALHEDPPTEVRVPTRAARVCRTRRDCSGPRRR